MTHPNICTTPTNEAITCFQMYLHVMRPSPVQACLRAYPDQTTHLATAISKALLRKFCTTHLESLSLLRGNLVEVHQHCDDCRGFAQLQEAGDLEGLHRTCV